MQKRTKGCLLIGAGVAVFLVMVGVAVVGGLGYYIFQQFGMHATFLKREDAVQQLDAVRARFAGQSPKIAIREADDGKPNVTLTKPVASPVSLTSLHVTAYDASKDKLVEMTIPFWLLRMVPEGGNMQMNGEEVLNHLSTPSGKLTAKDIEALGPGLLVDETRRDGTRVIIWSE
jgi:hypothetical protein